MCEMQLPGQCWHHSGSQLANSIASRRAHTMHARPGLGERGVRAEDIGQRAADELMDALEVGACTDEWLQDQLIIFMALAKVRKVAGGAWGRFLASGTVVGGWLLDQSGRDCVQCQPAHFSVLTHPGMLPPHAGPLAHADGRADAAHTHGVHGTICADGGALFGGAGAGGPWAGAATGPVAGRVRGRGSGSAAIAAGMQTAVTKGNPLGAARGTGGAVAAAARRPAKGSRSALPHPWAGRRDPEISWQGDRAHSVVSMLVAGAFCARLWRTAPGSGRQFCNSLVMQQEACLCPQKA